MVMELAVLAPPEAVPPAPSPAADRAAARADCLELVRAALEDFCEFIGSRPEASAVAIDTFLARCPNVAAGK